MLIVEVRDSGNIEKALKELKKKVVKTKLINELKERKEFLKPSVRRRNVIKKAQYIQNFRSQEN